MKRTFERAPQTALCDAAPLTLWLERAWPEPVRPHTPAWTLATHGELSPRDTVALMLAVTADPSIEQPPRYLSWLAQRCVAEPQTPPVDRWPQWQALAALPLASWIGAGRSQWLEVAPRTARALPFGLEDLAAPDEPADDDAPDVLAGDAPPPGTPTSPPAPLAPEAGDNGLDVRPGEGVLTAGSIWRATLDQLRMQLTHATYQTCVEGAQAIAYADGVLTVQAPHARGRDWLATRLRPAIEHTVARLAQSPVEVRYVLKGEA